MATHVSKPREYSAISPNLIVENAAAAVEFYCEVFGGTLIDKIAAEDGTIFHAEIKINDTVLMIGSEFPDLGHKSPLAYGGSPVTIHIYIDNVDDIVADAQRKGATLISEVEDKFYGDRVGTIKDPFGHEWQIATRIENLMDSEVQRRAKEEVKKLQNEQ